MNGSYEWMADEELLFIVIRPVEPEIAAEARF
jgi:hypothetical protein